MKNDRNVSGYSFACCFPICKMGKIILFLDRLHDSTHNMKATD